MKILEKMDDMASESVVWLAGWNCLTFQQSDSEIEQWGRWISLGANLNVIFDLSQTDMHALPQLFSALETIIATTVEIEAGFEFDHPDLRNGCATANLGLPEGKLAGIDLYASHTGSGLADTYANLAAQVKSERLRIHDAFEPFHMPEDLRQLPFEQAVIIHSKFRPESVAYKCNMDAENIDDRVVKLSPAPGLMLTRLACCFENWHLNLRRQFS